MKVLPESKINKKYITCGDIDNFDLREIVFNFNKAKILVIGDIILDEYLLGKPERISREAPVLVLDYVKSDYALGGSANAAANIAALGGRVTLMGILGQDDAASKVKSLCEDKNISLLSIIDPERGTTVKTRIISTSNREPQNGTGLKQQMLRLDRQKRNPIGDTVSAEIMTMLEREIAGADLILLSDYNSGLLTTNVAQAIIKLGCRSSKKVIVDSNGNFTKYHGAYSLTPNQPDVEAVLGYSIQTDDDLFKACKALLELSGANQVLITRGAKGMALFIDDKQNHSENLYIISALNPSEVFDVTGAGDTVAAVYSLGLAVQADSLKAAVIGNLAAGLVVKKYGTASVTKDELLNLLGKT